MQSQSKDRSNALMAAHIDHRKAESQESSQESQEKETVVKAKARCERGYHREKEGGVWSKFKQ